MKNTFKIIAIAAMTVLGASCSKINSDDKNTPINATVTFRLLEGGKYYMKVDEANALIPTNKNLQEYPFTPAKEKRALISGFLNNQEVDAVPGMMSTQSVVVTKMDTIRIKQPVKYDKAKDSEYGHDPIGLYLSDSNTFPFTMTEDGYLNLCFAINLAASLEGNVAHDINLLTGINPSDPYEVEVRHNANGDIQNGKKTSFIVCFPLNSLPDTEGKVVNLKLKWNSLATGKTETVEIPYISRKDW